MSSPTILASPSRRHHLSPVKPMKSNRLRGANSLNRNSSIGVAATFPTATKRSYSDENSDPSPAFAASPSKRVKSALPPALNAVLKSAVSSAPVPRAPKRAFGTLVDVTNTRANTIVPLKGRGGNGAFAEKASFAKSTFGKPARTILKPLSVAKKVSPSSSPKQPSPPRRAAARIRAPSPRRGSGRANKRSPLAYKRVDPPSSYFGSASSPSSIDSLLASVISRPSLFTIPVKTEVVTRKDDAPPLIAANIPDSWKFDIYEDSPEETLQNLMEHSTHTLDISDDSDAGSDTSELQEKGKENISPARLAELLAISPVERGNAMRVDVVDKAIPQQHRRVARRDMGEHREALREMQKEELLLALPEPEKKAAASAPVEEKEKEKEKEKLPTLVSENFPEFKPPTKKSVDVESESESEDQVATTPKSPGSPGWVVWESEHEHESEDEVSIAAKIPLPPSSELDFELDEQQPGFDVDAASLYGGSDQE